MSFHQFMHGYIHAALWTSTDENDVNLDSLYTADDLTPSARAAILVECTDFFEAYSDMWEDDELAGHDFWLTRNRHGVGFWDRPEVYGEKIAQALTTAAKLHTERYLMVDVEGNVDYV